MLLCGNDISFAYQDKKNVFKNKNITISSNERVAIFAPSGQGKSTYAKILAGYYKPDSGSVTFDGKPLPKKGFCPVQLIHQHPEKSVNPKWKIKKILQEGSMFDNSILEKLDIPLDYLERYPHELSGGQLQRICIARALNADTKFIIADEITTMLDTITQAKIWEFLLAEIKRRNIGLLVITHNKHLASKICTRIVDFNEM